jgi:hypothetical protein
MPTSKSEIFPAGVLHCRATIVPPAAEQVWKLIDTAREIGGFVYPITYLGAFCGLRRAEVHGLRFVGVRWFDNHVRVQYASPEVLKLDPIWTLRLGPIGTAVERSLA